jgi:hypothetical protein
MRESYNPWVVLVTQDYLKNLGADFEPHYFASSWHSWAKASLRDFLRQPIANEQVIPPEEKSYLQAVLELLLTGSQDATEWSRAIRKINPSERFAARGCKKKAFKARDDATQAELLRTMHIHNIRAGLYDATIRAAETPPLLSVALAEYDRRKADQATAGDVARRNGGDKKTVREFTALAEQATTEAANAVRRTIVGSTAQIVDGLVHARVHHLYFKERAGDRQREAIIAGRNMLVLLDRFTVTAEKALPKIASPA